MNSERIKALASDVFRDDYVLDVGCDHGYLAIYLKKNNLCAQVYASDISEKALLQAKSNFQKYNVDITSFVSDGFQNIPVYFNTAVISGMGTKTIFDILNSVIKPNKLIISSHNEYYKLRKGLNKLGYKIVDEQAIYENKHYYNIMLCLKKPQRLNHKELLFGISNNEEYYQYLLDKNREIIKKIPFLKRGKLWYYNHVLKGLIERK